MKWCPWWNDEWTQLAKENALFLTGQVVFKSLWRHFRQDGRSSSIGTFADCRNAATSGVGRKKPPTFSLGHRAAQIRIHVRSKCVCTNFYHPMQHEIPRPKIWNVTQTSVLFTRPSKRPQYQVQDFEVEFFRETKQFAALVSTYCLLWCCLSAAWWDWIVAQRFKIRNSPYATVEITGQLTLESNWLRIHSTLLVIRYVCISFRLLALIASFHLIK